ncbi:MAG: YkgJ family cysteine cluster protein [Nitrospirae bacterium]|nr:YkgJ family cysteine cluster protein [Nitrospirota bacterium]
MEKKTIPDNKISNDKGAAGCKSCGECCRGGAPTLLKQDAELFKSGVLKQSDVYTIRENEPVISKKDNSIYESIELIRIKEKPGTSECMFYDSEKGCAIYDNRPVQCVQYECWDQSGVLHEGLESSRLTRDDLFAESDEIIEIIRHHEDRCSYKNIKDAVYMLGVGEEAAVDELINILQYDTYSRPYIEENFSINPDMLELILGRPLIKTIETFGIQASQDGDNYMLSRIEEEPKQ